MKRVCLAVCLAAIALSAGCGSNVLSPLADDDTKEADITEARMALDDADYNTAISLVRPHYSPARPDPEAARILASAHMGKAGIDLTYLIGNIRGNDMGSPFDVISSALCLRVQQKGEARFVSKDDIDSLILPELEGAVGILGSLAERCTDDDAVQRGMAASLHFVTLAGSFASAASGAPAGFEGLAPVNEAAYRIFFPHDATLDERLAGVSRALENDDSSLRAMQDDLVYVNDALGALAESIGPGEDITEEVRDFLGDILGLSGLGLLDDSVVRASFTARRLSAFIRTMLAE